MLSLREEWKNGGMERGKEKGLNKKEVRKGEGEERNEGK